MWLWVPIPSMKGLLYEQTKLFQIQRITVTISWIFLPLRELVMIIMIVAITATITFWNLSPPPTLLPKKMHLPRTFCVTSYIFSEAVGSLQQTPICYQIKYSYNCAGHCFDEGYSFTRLHSRNRGDDDDRHRYHFLEFDPPPQEIRLRVRPRPHDIFSPKCLTG